MTSFKKFESRSWVAPFLEVRESSIDGNGVFTSKPIKAGEVVIVWGGVIFTAEEVAQGKAKNHTMVGIGEDLYLANPVDADFTVDDYMNHGCNPNIWMQDEITLITKREIQADEELTADYAIWLADENYIMKRQCNCGHHACRKVITGKDWRLKIVQEANRDHFSPFLNERIKKLQ